MSEADAAGEILKVMAPAQLIVQGSCLPFGFKTISDKRDLSRRRGLLAIGASLASLFASATTLVVMWPTLWRSIAVNRGPVEPVLVAFGLSAAFFAGCIVGSIILLVYAGSFYRDSVPRKTIL